MLNAALTPETFYIILSFLIANVFVCLFLMHRYLAQKRSNDRLNKALAAKPEEAIKTYLNQQFDRTRTKKFSADSEFSHDLANLRMAYLRIETNALDKQIDESGYWTFLQHNLQKLLNIISRSAPLAESKKNKLISTIEEAKSRLAKMPIRPDDERTRTIKSKTEKNLDLLQKKITSAKLNTSQLQKYQDRIAELIENYENPEKRKSHLSNRLHNNHSNQKRKAFDQIASHCDDNSATVNFVRTLDASQNFDNKLIDKLEEYEKENDRLVRLVERLKAQHDDNVENSSSLVKNSTTGALEATEEIITLNEQEITRLKEVIKSQRNKISELEEMTTQHSLEETDEAKQYASEISQLKRSALDSEMCIKILEDELESFKLNLRATHDTKNEISEQELEQLNNEIQSLKAEILKIESLNEQYSLLLQFVFDAFTATSVEDISLLLHESLSTINFSPLILIKTNDRLIELSENNKIATKDKAIINAMQLNEINRQRNGQLIFRFETLSGLIIPTKHNNAPQDLHEHVTQILKLSNTVIKQILISQKSQTAAAKVVTSVENIQKASFDIDLLLDEYMKEAKQAVNDSFALIKDSAKAKGMPASQIAALQSIEQDLAGQLRAQDIVRPKIRKRLLAIINILEGN